MSADKPRIGSVLFACTMNAVRSPIAEGVGKELFGRRVFVDSAGLRKTPRDPFALAVLREIGVEFADDDPHTLDEIDFESFDVVVTLSKEAHDHILEKARASAVEVIHWPIDDPTVVDGSRESRLQAYRAARDRIRALIREHLSPRVARSP
jgi:protein-tyrosine-phosphatase